jgi:hypothetical protein
LTDPFRIWKVVPREVDAVLFSLTSIFYLAAAFLLFSHFAKIVLAYNLGRDIQQLSILMRKIFVFVVFLLVFTIIPVSVWSAIYETPISIIVYVLLIGVYGVVVIGCGIYFSVRLKNTIQIFSPAPDKLFLKKVSIFFLNRNCASV